MRDPQIYDQDRVRFEVMRHFGYFVTESTRHMCEYVPYFRRTRELAERFAPPWRRDYDLYVQRQATYYEKVARQIAGAEPIPTERTHEYCSYIIHAIETNEPFRINANVPNRGLITNLPAGACVEVPCLVDARGVHPCQVGDLPPQLAALNRSNIAVQELAVKTALEHNREAARQAVALDPLTASVLTLEQAAEMTDELFAASRRWLDWS
jgi:alpha-galactosidase